jgi:hypothetical protein
VARRAAAATGSNDESATLVSLAQPLANLLKLGLSVRHGEMGKLLESIRFAFEPERRSPMEIRWVRCLQQLVQRVAAVDLCVHG